MTTQQNFWRNCSACKKPIGYGAKHYVCSVSTCNGQRTGYVFCSVSCFERHIPGARHKDAAAIESQAPAHTSVSASATNPDKTTATAAAPRRTIVGASGSATNLQTTKYPQEILIIASRLKEYIQARSDFNTSAQVMDVLSDYVRVLCDRAIDNARSEGRKTVLDRDFNFLKNLR